MTNDDKHPAVGIDLGTTFSAVAYLDPSGRPETIRSAEGDLTTPSAVFFDRKSPLVGIEAVEAGLLEPERLALYAKRDVGEDTYEKQIRGENFPPEVLQALVLRKLKADAELKLGKVEKAVVTVPAFFNEPCRKATQDAGRLAGLEVLDIINEPTAAAITYGVQQGFLSESGKSDKLERVLVYDLGGGTFDVTVMEIDKGNYHTIATAGDVYLGGIDWDSRVVDFIAEQFQKEHGLDPRDDPQANQELIRKANQTKHALTQRESVSIAFAHDGMRLRCDLSQAEFAKLTEDLVERTLMTVRLVLDDSGLDWSDLTRLILVGGSTRMPMIRDELEKHSGFELDRSLSPDEAVSHGAALYAGMLLGHSGEHAKVSVTNVNSHDLGILAVDPKTGEPRRQVMIPRNSSLPCQKQMRFRTHQNNQANVKIEIIEGGDDKGTNATKIGKCIVDKLPKNTPKGTSIDVLFDYGQDGRLKIGAELPDIDRNVQMTLDRAAGLSSDEIDSWRKRIDDGLVDPEPNAIQEGPDELLPDDDAADIPFVAVVESKSDSKAKPKPKATGFPGIDTGEGKAAAKPAATPKKLTPLGKAPIAPADNSSDAKPKSPVKLKPVVSDSKSADATPPKKLKTVPTAEKNPEAAGKPEKPKLKTEKPKLKRLQPKPVVKSKPVAEESAGDETPTIGPPKKKAKPVAQKKPAAGPKLDVGETGNAEKVSVKPGDPDFSQLMSLGGSAPKEKKKGGMPQIITTDKTAAKKKGDWKSRGKKLSTEQEEE